MPMTETYLLFNKQMLKSL